MSTGTLTLAEFLLARIDEDEVRAGRYHRLLCARRDDGVTLGQCNCEHPARLLAEYEAKRRIAERVRDAPRAREPWDDGWHCGMGDALEFIAAVYAEHPDYRQEWRP